MTDVRTAIGADGLLGPFNAAGVLTAADVHVAQRLCALGFEADQTVALAAALAVRAPRLGHVHVDLATIATTATAAGEGDEEVDVSALDWPSVEAWVTAVAASALTAPDGPLRLDETRLYLDRYWRDEQDVGGRLLVLAGEPKAVGDEATLVAGLARLFADEPRGRQARAAEAAVRRRLAVVAGGPGTGKTTTVARIVALHFEQAPQRPPLIALAAPTGKAAARLEEAVHDEARRIDIDDTVRDALIGLHATTIHRLLGWRPGSHSRFRHDAQQRLPHDVVIVDETSMVSLSLMARLLEALRPETRLVLVGDPGQLASVEAGAVLGDIVGDEPREGMVVLDRLHRYGGAIAELADHIRRGDADAVIALLKAGADDVTWIAFDADDDPGDTMLLDPVRGAAIDAGRRVLRAARAGEVRAALDALGDFRILCAHREGRHGVAAWNAAIEGWLGVPRDDQWYVGRPLLVNHNDYELGLFNGDVGVVVAGADDRVEAAFERRGEPVTFSPARLAAVSTVHAMTIHKSQGSQFRTAAVLLPAPESRILTRELLYTAATRARERLLLVSSEEAIRAAVLRPVARASGLRRLLWGD